MPREYHPPAPPELSEGYAVAADLADRRRQQVLARGDVEEAAVWGQVAEYCSTMARTRATDDDQYQFQRDRQRHRKDGTEVVLMAPEDIDAFEAMDSVLIERRQLSPFAEALIEVALMQVSPVQRVCLELVVGGLVDVKDVAAALSITPAQVRQHVSRGKMRLQQVRQRIQHLIPGPTICDPERWYVKRSAS